MHGAQIARLAFNLAPGVTAPDRFPRGTGREHAPSQFDCRRTKISRFAIPFEHNMCPMPKALGTGQRATSVRNMQGSDTAIYGYGMCSCPHIVISLSVFIQLPFLLPLCPTLYFLTICAPYL